MTSATGSLPPDSHSYHQRRKPHKHDPFLDLPILPSASHSPSGLRPFTSSTDAVNIKTSASPSSHEGLNQDEIKDNQSRNQQHGDAGSKTDPDSDGLLTKLLWTPLYMTSFLLSLFLANYLDRSRRAQSSNSESRLWVFFSPSSWLDPEPYQDPGTGSWRTVRRDSVMEQPHMRGGHGGPMEEERRQGKSWYIRKKHRAVMRMEIGDAFEGQGKIMVMLGVALVLGTVAMGWIGWIVWGLFRK
jgi:hypothetical protein